MKEKKNTHAQKKNKKKKQREKDKMETEKTNYEKKKEFQLWSESNIQSMSVSTI